MFNNISDIVMLYALKTPNKTYMIDDKRSYTYLESDHMIDSICEFFGSHGIEAGDRISAIIKNSTEYILLYMATLRYGCSFNPYPYTLSSGDIIRYLDDFKPNLVLCQEKHYDELNSYNRHEIIKIDDEFISGLNPAVFIGKDNCEDIACIYYSSGTTGSPKSIMLTHKNILVDTEAIVNANKFNENENHLIILQMGHTSPLDFSVLPCTMCGATIVIAESFWSIRHKFWRMIKEHKITYVQTVPSIIIALLNTPYDEEEYKDISHLRFICSSSATLLKNLQIRFMKKYKIKLCNSWGLSETGPSTIDYPLDEDWEYGSVGKPLSINEIKIARDGEILVKGDNVFIGYYNNQKLYDEMVVDGYFHTGDLGCMDNGRLMFLGRKKDIIIKGGENISPDEIDEVIYKMEDINESVTIGVQNDYLGEIIKTYIVPKKEIDKKDIIAFCKKHLSRDKIPDVIEFVDEIPKNASGKPLRKKLRDRNE